MHMQDSKEYLNTKNNVAGCILAGGLAVRANGADKGKFLLGQVTFLERILEAYDDLGECLLSYNKDISNLGSILDSVNQKRINHQLSPVIITKDLKEIEQKGPMSGMYSALRKTKCGAVIFCPCDVPFFDQSMVEILLTNFGGRKPVVFRTQQGIQPLCGIYPVSMIDDFKYCLEHSLYKIKFVLDRAEAEYIDAQKAGIPESKFKNINTWEEFEQLKMEYQKSHSGRKHNF